MKKTITFGIPCYNSSEYMDHCIESILEGSDYANAVAAVFLMDCFDDVGVTFLPSVSFSGSIILYRAVINNNNLHVISVIRALEN